MPPRTSPDNVSPPVVPGPVDDVRHDSSDLPSSSRRDFLIGGFAALVAAACNSKAPASNSRKGILDPRKFGEIEQAIDSTMKRYQLFYGSSYPGVIRSILNPNGTVDFNFLEKVLSYASDLYDLPQEELYVSSRPSGENLVSMSVTHGPADSDSVKHLGTVEINLSSRPDGVDTVKTSFGGVQVSGELCTVSEQGSFFRHSDEANCFVRIDGPLASNTRTPRRVLDLMSRSGGGNRSETTTQYDYSAVDSGDGGQVKKTIHGFHCLRGQPDSAFVVSPDGSREDFYAEE